MGIKDLFLHTLDLAGHIWYCMCRQKDKACPIWTAAKSPGGCSSGAFLFPVLEWKGLSPQVSYRCLLLSNHLMM